jgi:hypothetical protein
MKFIVSLLGCLMFFSCIGYESVSEEPQPDSFSQALSGHWMREQIGDCIWFEEWLSFDPPDGFVSTLVERNACDLAGHGVFPAEGSLQIEEGQTITWDVTAPDGRRVMRNFTAAIAGDSLNTTAFMLSADGSYHARYRRLIEDSSGFLDQDVRIDLSFDSPLQSDSVVQDCEMTVTINVTADAGTDALPETGTETLVLTGTCGPDEESGWIRLHFGDWWDALAEKDVWDKYPAQISNAIYDSFHPDLFIEPDNPKILFQNGCLSWYRRMANPPPTSEEFWSQEPCYSGDCIEIAGEYEIHTDCPDAEEGLTATITQDRCKLFFEGPLADLIGPTGCSYQDSLYTQKGCSGYMTPLCRAPSYDFLCTTPHANTNFCTVTVIMIW